MARRGKVWKLTNDEFTKIINLSASYTNARIKIYGKQGNINSVRERCNLLNLDVSHFTNRKSKVWLLSKEEFVCLVNKSRSYNQLVMCIFKHPCNVRTIKDRIKRDKIDVSHFKGQKWAKNKKGISVHYRYTLEELLVKKSKYKGNGQRIKKRLIREGLFKEDKCKWCGIGPEYNGKPLTLQLDHINGDNNDNRLKNLRILCPNCHSQTKTWCSKKRNSCG